MPPTERVLLGVICGPRWIDITSGCFVSFESIAGAIISGQDEQEEKSTQG
jgi:hypothetical protein